MRVYDSTRRPLCLGTEVAKGGEGTIYEVKGDPGILAKIYDRGMTDRHQAKLKIMVQNQSEALRQFTAWPVDILYLDRSDRVSGFVMQRATGPKEIHELYSPKSRLTKFSNAGWAFLVGHLSCTLPFHVVFDSVGFPRIVSGWRL